MVAYVNKHPQTAKNNRNIPMFFYNIFESVSNIKFFTDFFIKYTDGAKRRLCEAKSISKVLNLKKFSFSIAGITVSPTYIKSNKKRIPSVNPR